MLRFPNIRLSETAGTKQSFYRCPQITAFLPPRDPGKNPLTSAPEYVSVRRMSWSRSTSWLMGMEWNCRLKISLLVAASGKGTYTILSILPGRIRAWEEDGAMWVNWARRWPSPWTVSKQRGRPESPGISRPQIKHVLESLQATSKIQTDKPCSEHFWKQKSSISERLYAPQQLSGQ